MAPHRDMQMGHLWLRWVGHLDLNKWDIRLKWVGQLNLNGWDIYGSDGWVTVFGRYAQKSTGLQGSTLFSHHMNSQSMAYYKCVHNKVCIHDLREHTLSALRNTSLQS